MTSTRRSGAPRQRRSETRGLGCPRTFRAADGFAMWRQSGQYALMGINRLGAIGIDCADPRMLAAFYEKLTGWRVESSSDDFAALRGGPMWLTFHRKADYRRPTWESPLVPKQMHLDFAVDDLDEAQSEALQAGAVMVDPQPRPKDWRVLLDPEGHPFCLCAAIPS